jgi:hypothetical protein
MTIKFVVKSVLNENIAALQDCVVKEVIGQEDDVWCSIADLDNLLNACETRWGNNWDLNKVCVAIAEANFE